MPRIPRVRRVHIGCSDDTVRGTISDFAISHTRARSDGPGMYLTLDTRYKVDCLTSSRAIG